MSRPGAPNRDERARRDMLYLSGADLIAAAALRSGCDFFAGYPITPASSILTSMLRDLPGAGGIGVQAEDEIAALSMCIAAAMAGRRVMTATSGPGLSLMSENIGLAQMAEVPLVVVNVQRMGPATGGATTNAEGDVQFARWLSSGGYPLVVYAPSDGPSTWRLTCKAFATAEQLRTPVVLLTSKNLVMTSETVDPAALEEIPIAPRRRGDEAWRPYAMGAAEDVPPFLVFGEDLTRLTTSIHDERGIITESPAKAGAKLAHLIAKIQSRADDLAEIDIYGAGGETAIVAYGSPARTARAALSQLDASTRLIVLHTLSPLPEERLRAALHGVKRIVVPELNPGLLAPDLERLAPAAEVRRLNRLDGALISPLEILQAAAP